MVSPFTRLRPQNWGRESANRRALVRENQVQAARKGRRGQGRRENATAVAGDH